MSFLDRIQEVIVTGFYFGKSPIVPGTCGTLWGIPLVFLLQKIAPIPGLIALLLFIIAGIFIIDIYEKKKGNHDASEIVLDEIAGYAVSMALLPGTIPYYLYAFILFRIFDMWKPFPISVLDQKVQGGVGVMADDLLAGVFANIILQYLQQNFAGSWGL